jgi:glycosyltransferase involved in cell wall biosynthesis
VLGQATALLFPIAWPEAFGLVMIEAMACGTYGRETATRPHKGLRDSVEFPF